jgi:hypothetical protein
VGEGAEGDFEVAEKQIEIEHWFSASLLLGLPRVDAGFYTTSVEFIYSMTVEAREVPCGAAVRD